MGKATERYGLLLMPAAFLVSGPVAIAITISPAYGLGAFAIAVGFVVFWTCTVRYGFARSRPLLREFEIGIHTSSGFFIGWLFWATIDIINWLSILVSPLIAFAAPLAVPPWRWYFRAPVILVLIPTITVLGVLGQVGWAAALGALDRHDGTGSGPPPAAANHPSLTSSDLALARAYRPLYFIADNDDWHPTSVDLYLDDQRTTLVGDHGDKVLAKAPLSGRLGELRTSCAEAAAGCVITLNCPEPHESCAEDDPTAQPVVYAKVDRNPWASEPDLVRPSQGLLSTLSAVITYWAFYRYDEWDANLISQWHEGDWEAVAVGLARDRPLFVAFSAHCDGSWREWRKGEIVAFADQGRSKQPSRSLEKVSGHHVGVFVASGSHANYFSDQTRSPLWTVCRGLDPTAPHVRGLVALTFGSHAVERFGYPESKNNPDVYFPRVLLASNAPALTFPARWGRKDKLTWLDIVLSERKGPDSPSRQPPWTAPLRTTFCDWSRSEECPASRPAG